MQNTTIMFILIFTGFISFFRQSLNILMLFLGFPIMVYIFVSNPNDFYSSIGIDPEIVNNLPTFPASEAHINSGSCIICHDEILLGQELLTLRCPGKYEIIFIFFILNFYSL
jgi:hypothetical protein